MSGNSHMENGRSPRRSELQGPRPTPLRIHKDSHKIRKPPVAPPPAGPHPPQPPRQPIIIYTVSPKIIHTNPNEFMNLVQRLTGLETSSASTSTSTMTTSMNTNNPSFYDGGAISPAARYATIEKANNSSPQGGVRNTTMMTMTGFADHQLHTANELGFDQNMEMLNFSNNNNNNNNKGLFSGILSPGPASLPPITPNFFFPPSDAFFHDLISPAIQNNNQRSNNFIEGSLMASPMAGSSFFVSPRTLMTSPTTPSLDHLLFTNVFFDNL